MVAKYGVQPQIYTLLYQLLWNIENSNQLPQQFKHTRTKFYIYVIPEYRVPWLDI
jgi:hypothetical protein